MIAIADLLSAVASLLILSSTFPQAFHIMRARMTRDILMKFLSICVCGQKTWTTYVVVTHQPIFIIGEGVDVALWSVVLAIKLFNVREGEEEEQKEQQCDCKCNKCKKLVVKEVNEVTR